MNVAADQGRSVGPASFVRNRHDLPRGSTREALPRVLRRRINRLAGSGGAPFEWPPTFRSHLTERDLGPCFRRRITPTGGTTFRCGWCPRCTARKLRKLLGRAWALVGEDPGLVRVRETATDEEWTALRRGLTRYAAFVQGTSERRIVLYVADGPGDGLSERGLADRMLDAALGMRGSSAYDSSAWNLRVPDEDPAVATAKASQKQIQEAAAHLGYGVRWESWGKWCWTLNGDDVVLPMHDFVGIASMLSPGYAARAAPVPLAA